MVKTMRIPKLEAQMAKVLSTARDEEVVDLTINKLLKIIAEQEKEIQRLKGES